MVGVVVLISVVVVTVTVIVTVITSHSHAKWLLNICLTPLLQQMTKVKCRLYGWTEESSSSNDN